jgi:hypothetical protein
LVAYLLIAISLGFGVLTDFFFPIGFVGFVAILSIWLTPVNPERSGEGHSKQALDRLIRRYSLNPNAEAWSEAGKKLGLSPGPWLWVWRSLLGAFIAAGLLAALAYATRAWIAYIS